MLSAPKEDSRASEATRRFVQEEEERLILQKGPLQRKLADISQSLALDPISILLSRTLVLELGKYENIDFGVPCSLKVWYK